jgi:hypothetical protein
MGGFTWPAPANPSANTVSTETAQAPGGLSTETAQPSTAIPTNTAQVSSTAEPTAAANNNIASSGSITTLSNPNALPSINFDTLSTFATMLPSAVDSALAPLSSGGAPAEAFTDPATLTATSTAAFPTVQVETVYKTVTVTPTGGVAEETGAVGKRHVRHARRERGLRRWAVRHNAVRR